MRQASVASLGIAGVSKIRSFDRAGADAAIGNVLKDIVVSDDGRTQYYRKFDKGTQTWSSWISGSISGIGIAGLGTVKSLSPSVIPVPPAVGRRYGDRHAHDDRWRVAAVEFGAGFGLGHDGVTRR